MLIPIVDSSSEQTADTAKSIIHANLPRPHCFASVAIDRRAKSRDDAQLAIQLGWFIDDAISYGHDDTPNIRNRLGRVTVDDGKISELSGRDRPHVPW